MTENKRVIIAGAGPGGLLAARELASAGFSVQVFEALSEEAYMSQHNWSDAIEFAAFKWAGMPVPGIEGERYVGEFVRPAPGEDGLFEPHIIRNLAIYSPEYKCRTKTDVSFRYALTDRQVLRRIQLEQANNSGAEVFFERRIDGLLGKMNCPLQQVKIEGVKIGDTDYPADLVIDASGQDGALRKMTGCPALQAPVSDTAKSEAFRVVRRYTDDNAPYNFLDHYCYGAYRGYFWLHFHDDGIVDIGGGLPLGCGAKEKVMEMLTAFPNVTNEEIRGGSGVVCLNEPPSSLVADGFMIVGDSAGQINPNNGCGVGGAWLGALAATTAVKQSKDFSISSLWPYNVAWFHGRGAHFSALNAIKNLLQDLSHDDITLMMQCGVLSGELLTNNLNGEFVPPSSGEMVKALGLLFRRPSLLGKVMKANAAGAKCFKRYKAFPAVWSNIAFEQWLEAKT